MAAGASIVHLLLTVGVAVVIVVVLGVVLNVRRDDRVRRHPATPGHAPRGPAWHGASPVAREPSVRIGRLVVAILFFPIVVIVWAVASLGDLVEGAVHLVVGAVGVMVALVESLTGSRATGPWRRAGRELGRFGENLYSVGRRFVEYVGFGGFLSRVEEGIREASGRGPLAPTPPVVGRSRTETFPFEDRYRIESHLQGGGSTARLFVVRRLERGRPVGDRLVLKYFDMGLGSRLEEVLRESRGMQTAREMGIVLDHDLGPDHFYYVMPYYEGETLTRAAARIHRRLLSGEGMEKQDLETCLDWMGQTLRILDAYHRRGVIHKDVKPDNLIVTADGVRLVDLGLMTPVESALTLTTHGTEYFRDPEMVKLAIQGKRVRDVDAVRFDVYSAGAVLYLLLEGSFPACGPLSRFSRPVPMALGYVTSRAMAEGSKRYGSIAVMRADLEAYRAFLRDRSAEEIAVSALPSFRGLEAAEVAAGEPDADASEIESRFAAPPPPVSAPPPLPPLPRFSPPAEPPRRRSSGALALLVVVVLLLAAAVGAALRAPRRRPATAPRPAEAQEAVWRLDPAAAPRLVSFFRDTVEKLRQRDKQIPVDVSVLVVTEGTQLLDELEQDARRAFVEAGIATAPSERLVARVRAYLAPGGRSATEVEDLLRREDPEGTPSFVLWLLPDAPDAFGRRTAEVRLFSLGEMAMLKAFVYADRVRG